jgi:hypothetical protein
MVMINASSESQTLDMSRFSERMTGFNRAYEVITEQEYNSISEITVPARKAFVFELK